MLFVFNIVAFINYQCRVHKKEVSIWTIKKYAGLTGYILSFRGTLAVQRIIAGQLRAVHGHYEGPGKLLAKDL